jgi:thiosulfate dehydrogenase
MKKILFGFVLGLLALPLILLVGAFLGLFPIRGRVKPSEFEMWMAQRALSASVARHAQEVQNPVTANEQELLIGMKVYLSNCAGCYRDPSGPSQFGACFYPPVPQFASTPPAKPDWQMFWIVKNGVRYSGMPSWEGVIGEKEMWQAVTFLNHLRSLPSQVQEKWQKKP